MFIFTDETGNVIRKDDYSICGKTPENIYYSLEENV
jgi:hypothetical protein